MRQFLAFLRLQALKANADFIALLRQHFVGVAITLLAAGAVLPFVEYVGADPIQEAGLTLLYSFVGPVVILAVVYMVIFARAPSRLYFDKNAEATALAERLRTIEDPRLSLDLSLEPFAKVSYGATMESPFSGHRETQIFGRETILRITCRNESGLRINACEANLVNAKEIDDFGNEHDLGFRESVRLLWSRAIKNQEFVADIQPGTSRLIYLLVCRDAGILLYRETAEIPLEYHRIFMSLRHFRLWIQVNGANDTGARICIDVEKASGDGNEWTAQIVNASQPGPHQLPLGTE